MKNKAIIIVGMHRSGTSLIAGMLKILGIDFGNNLLEAKIDNPKGFFEHKEILRINEEILKSLKSSYDDINPLPSNWVSAPEIKTFKERIKEVLTKDFQHSKIFGIKEPRITLLLPLYLEIFNELKIKPHFIITRRKDIEIAKSLEIRNNFSIKKSLILCKKYEWNISNYTEKQEKVEIQFDELIKKPMGIIKKIEKSFKIKLDYIKSKKRLFEFISPDLKHHNISNEQFIYELSEKIEKEEKEMKLLLEKIGEKEKNIKNLSEKIGEKEKNIKNLSEKIGEKEKNIKNLSEKIGEKEKNIKNLSEKIGEKEKNIKGLSDKIKTKTKNEEQLNDALEKINLLNRQKEHLIWQQQKNIRHKEGIISSLDRQIKSIERSMTWKMLKKYQKFVNIIFPNGTKIRNIYDSIIRKNQSKLNSSSLPSENQVIENKAKQFLDNFGKTNGKTDILFVNHEETRTGAPKILFEIAKHMKKKYRIAMLSKTEGSMHEEFLNEFKQIIYPEKIYPKMEKNETAKKILMNIKPSVVYVNTIVGHEYAFEAKKLGIPVILHVHELENSFDSILKDKKEHIKDNADLFIAVSGKVHSLLVDKLKCEKSKVRLIHEFIDSNEIIDKSNEIQKSEIYNEMNKKNNQIIVLALGSLIPRKGADILMDASKMLPEKKFVWVGGFNREKSMEVVRKKSEVKDNFIMLGEKENPYPYLKAADIFVLPSREDPFPLVVLEAMALGKPIIAFEESGGVSEAIKDCGVLLKKVSAITLAKAIGKLANDKNKQSLLGKKAKIEQKKYEKSEILKKVDEIISLFFKENKQNEEKVSIVLPSYNYDWCIKEAIESVINQTYKNWELIIIDDHSTDNSSQIIDYYVKKYPNQIKQRIKNKEEKGIALSYKRGIENASGKYICFLEADDLLMKDSIESRLAILKKNEDISLVYNGIELFGKNKKLINAKKIKLNEYFKGIQIPLNCKFNAHDYLCDRNIVLTFSSVMVRKDAVLNLDFSDKYGAWFDWWFYTQVSLKGDFFFLKDKKTLWRIHEDSYNHKCQEEEDTEKKTEMLQEDIINLGKKNTKDKTLYIFVHTPKCAGSTFVEQLKNNFKKEEILPIYQSNLLKDSKDIDNYLASLSSEDKDKIKFIYGHHVYYGIHKLFNKKAKYITFLRNPIERAISHYNFCRTQHESKSRDYSPPVISKDGKILQFKEWINYYKDQLDNYMLRFFARDALRKGKNEEKITKEDLAKVKEMLNDFYFVGTTENYDEEIKKLYSEIGIKDIIKNQNVSKKYFVPDKKDHIKQILLERNKLDIELYEFAKGLNKILK